MAVKTAVFLRKRLKKMTSKAKSKSEIQKRNPKAKSKKCFLEKRNRQCFLETTWMKRTFWKSGINSAFWNNMDEVLSETTWMKRIKACTGTTMESKAF